MFAYYQLALKRYAEFGGRSRRSEYWYFQLVNFLISMVFMVIIGFGAFSFVGGSAEVMPPGEPPNIPVLFWGLYGILMLYSLAVFIPSLAVLVRRLHDVGRSGWWYFIAFIPLIGAIVLLVWLASDGQPGANKWGPNPKTGVTAEDKIIDHLI